MKCKYCNINEVVKYSKYSDGTFCSKKCARGYSTKEMRQEINEKVSNTLMERNKGRISWNKGRIPWNKGLTKETDERLKKISDNHRGQVPWNRGRTNVYSEETLVKIREALMGHFVSNETRKNLSLAVKKSYENGKPVFGGITRWVEVETTHGKIKVQGTYELRTCKILDRWKRDGDIKDWEYTNDRIKYIGVDGKEHFYLLDFKVLDNDENFYYIETKGYERENDKLKWDAVKRRGYELKVWFEEDIKKYEFIKRQNTVE